eukprot:GILI01031837.1.p1 GENE.GILI01031837.1~~GILI01031837.1.p1  ORF type:complete len:235 (-),score=54.89 GILI01031837.1:79-783(-)
MTDAKTEIDRLSSLAATADPFSILGIEVFRVKPDASTTATTTRTADPPPTAREEASQPQKASAAPPKGPSDDYERLKVEHTDVRKAYRRLSLLLHSDKCSIEGAADALLRVSKAYEMLPTEATVERFIMQLERIKKRDIENRKRLQQAEEDRKRKIASGAPTGNGIANFSTMSVTQRIAAIAEQERKERSDELTRKADAIAKRQTEDRQRAEDNKERGATLAKQAAEWSNMMDM